MGSSFFLGAHFKPELPWGDGPTALPAERTPPMAAEPRSSLTPPDELLQPKCDCPKLLIQEKVDILNAVEVSSRADCDSRAAGREATAVDTLRDAYLGNTRVQHDGWYRGDEDEMGVIELKPSIEEMSPPRFLPPAKSTESKGVKRRKIIPIEIKPANSRDF